MLSLIRRFSTKIPTYRVAIVGSGPAGFYTAYHLLSKVPKQKFNVKVDFFERLPAPFGLSRYGVAPDHPEVKNCEEYLRDLMVNYPDQTRFFGNVNVGKDISLSELQQHYHSICLAYGCVTGDNKLNIPGADNPNVISARQFVNWYNGHPDCYSNSFQPPDLTKIRNVTIIGNGNVALDVTRILLADPKSHWSTTDITQDALGLLEKSSVKNVNIVARRGILQSAFSTKEIREILDLNKTEKVKFIPIDEEIWTEFEPEIKSLDRPNKRKFTTIQKYLNPSDYVPEKTWSLQYLKTPQEFVIEDNELVKTVFTKNRIVSNDQGKQIVAVDDPNDTFELENDLVILSIGYRGSPLPESESLIGFDSSKSHIPNKGGRVLDDSKNISKGFYSSGWIKNGPNGIIATTMMDSFDTGFNILEDLSNEVFIGDEEKPDIASMLPENTVQWNNWLNLDNFELEVGKELGKPREKVVKVEKMIEIACK